MLHAPGARRGARSRGCRARRRGCRELREQIATRLVQHGIAAGAANIITTYGASQAFDLLARILLAPGDAVLVEDPGYFVLFEQLRAHHVRLIPVPRHADGPDLAALEAACRAHRPRAFFMQTLVHNPTGSSADPAHCHRILSLAEQYGFAMVEDDVYGDLYEGPPVRLAQIDGLRHVIYVGSYTKLIGPALRVGFVAADAALIARLVERKVLSVLSGSTLLECFVSEVLDGGRYKRHVEQTRARLARMRARRARALESAGIAFERRGRRRHVPLGPGARRRAGGGAGAPRTRALDPAGARRAVLRRAAAADSGCASTSRTATVRRWCSSCAGRCARPEGRAWSDSACRCRTRPRRTSPGSLAIYNDVIATSTAIFSLSAGHAR